MTEKITAKRVCRVLEVMYLLDMHQKLADNRFVLCETFPDTVYKWCHITSGTCKNPHDDWVEDFLNMEKELVRIGELPE